MTRIRFLGFLIPAIFLLTCFSVHSSVCAEELDQKALLVQKELDCVSQNLKSNGTVEWNDFCYTPHSYESYEVTKEKIVTETLDYYAKDSSDYTAPSPRRAQETPQKDSSEKYDDYYNDKGDDMSAWDSEKASIARENPLTKFEFGSEIFHMTYREPGFMRQKGYMSGVFASYTRRLSLNRHVKTFKDILQDGNKLNMFKFDGRFAWGYMDYESEGTGTQDDIRDYVYELRAVTGYDFPIEEKNRITPYFGVGYRYLNDDGAGTTSTGHWGYERESMYVYIPCGVEMETTYWDNWILGATLEYDFFTFGTQKSHFEDGNPNYDPVTNNQDNGYGLRGSVKITRESKEFDFYCEPFIRYWSLKDSDPSDVIYTGYIVGTGLEPENNTTEFGIKLGASF